MAEAIRFRTVVSGSTLTISDLGRFDGKHVEVIVLDDEPADLAEGTPARPQRRFGTMAGRIKAAPDFDAPVPEIDRSFEGHSDP